MDAWLTEAAAGLGLSEGDLSPEDETLLLDQARIAAHASARTNAPLWCYLLGVAAGRSGRDLRELVG